MPWTPPVDRATSYTVTSADWSAGSQDDLTFLYGDTGWTNVSVFTNSWVTHGAGVTPRFILIGRVVYLDGSVQSGTLTAAAFTLPVGYRPTQALTLPAMSNGALGLLQINTAGTVVPQTGSNVYFVLNCCFPVV